MISLMQWQKASDEQLMGKDRDFTIKRETVTRADLLKVLDLTETPSIWYWLDGGWGVDVLLGRQIREHRGVDINFDARYTNALLRTLVSHRYEVTADWRPVRIEPCYPELSYMDIYPFVISEDGTTKQADLEGGWYEFEAGYFGSAVFEGRTISCISAGGQRIFHTGYELREVDKHDTRIIGYLLSAQSSDRDETEGAICRAKKWLRNWHLI